MLSPFFHKAHTTERIKLSTSRMFSPDRLNLQMTRLQSLPVNIIVIRMTKIILPLVIAHTTARNV